ncbi:MAG: NERD domain-containing protein, partial [Verrucomicrobiae bacterium]|nr:NERD domain-containing protein [Verrucomicrobiae bacterium]
MLISPHLILTLVLLGPGILAGYIFLKKIQQNRVRLTEPLEGGTAIRLPGHSLLEKIEKTHEEVADKILFLIFPTLIHALVFYAFFEERTGNEWTFVFLFGIETGIIALVGFRLWRLLKEIEVFRLGFRGEVFVSQILQPLTLMGYRVFHDLEFGSSKIDHVLMNDSGIFCLETETPEKPKGYRSKSLSEVIYDGSSLQYPWGKDTAPLKHLQRNASALAKYLREQIGESIPIYPILLL